MSDKKSSGFLSNLFGTTEQELPGTTITKEELAAAIGEAIRESFKQHIPQPADMADAIRKAVAAAGRDTADEVAKLQTKFLESESAQLEKWTHVQGKTLDKLEHIQKALESFTEKLGDALHSGSDKISGAVKSQSKELAEVLGHAAMEIKGSTQGEAEKIRGALKQHVEQLTLVNSTAKDQLETVLTEHVAKLQGATNMLASQLTQIAELEAQIKEVLHIEQVVDGTLKSISAAEEFKQAFVALQKHLAASDQLLREVTKPRTITLVETESEP